MRELPDVMELGPEEEGHRLWEAGKEAQISAPYDLVSLCQAVDLGLRAAEILITHHLQPVKDQFPATIGIQLDTPDPVVDAHRDAVSIPNTLSFTAILDLLSAEGLECVSPGLHRGWEDRRFSCKRSRVTAFGALGIDLDEEVREHLLLLSAYRNRVFRSPPPVQVIPADILNAFPALNRLVDQLP